MSCFIYFRALTPEVECHGNGVIIRFLCASYRSLYLLSSLSLVRLCDVLFLVTSKIIPTSFHKSYLLQSYCTHHFQNPYIFSSKLAGLIIQGLNLTHLVLICSSKMRLVISFDIECAIECAPYLMNGIGLIFGGAIKTLKTRFLPKMNALSLSSFTNTILDIGIISSVSSLGLVGVKLGTIL